MPRPPRHVGRQTVVQATLHLRSIVDSAPDQMNARRRLSIWQIAHCERQHVMLRCTGMAESVTLVSRTRPALVSKPDCHVGILAAIASTNGCSSALVNLLSERNPEVFARECGDHTLERQLHSRDHVIRAPNRSGDAFVNVCHQPGRPS
jgi:hypothetical protein